MKSDNFPFICPVCRKKLVVSGNSAVCESGHSFDFAKQGYLNLYQKSSKGKRHGDDRLMLSSRREFLNKGYYEKLRKAVSLKLGADNTILDAGCGEGYYTRVFAENNFVSGIDISKDAVKLASSSVKNAYFAVASAFDIPSEDGYFDAVVNIFSPDSEKEYLRVLKKEGRLIIALPMENHLMGLKKAVYDKPYLNPPVNLVREGFSLLSSDVLKYKITLHSTEDIISLFRMTPYFYKTGAEDQKKLEKLNSLETELEFLIAEYIRN